MQKLGLDWLAAVLLEAALKIAFRIIHYPGLKVGIAQNVQQLSLADQLHYFMLFWIHLVYYQIELAFRNKLLSCSIDFHL